ncbi:MAG: putative unusual protein kinase regulating ubiquinone biosynthesis (AarF/ABC1/UbiB family) [Halieaceae bacterium]|jgi:predicted unusual protein kinase regulating ubiquinone biosynthesis (AarF/ABC1/UbiB family)
MAGIRAGGAFAVDGVFQRIRGGGETRPENSAFARREARRLVNQLGQLKGTYVKIGQMLALLGEHFLPPVLTEELHHLESRTEPLDWSLIQSALEESLGPRLLELVVDPQALAAASLAQVHRATIKATGEKICLKVQYPGLADVIDADFDAVVRMLKLARWLPAGRDLDEWTEAMRDHLHNEIDYHREAEIASQMAGHIAQLDSYSIPLAVPAVYPRYCADGVLALEYIDGQVVTDDAIRALPLDRRNTLAKTMLELFFLEVYRWGLLQTDPNFGNYLIRSTPDGDQLVLLDFGSVLHCSDEFRRYLGNIIRAGLEMDTAGVIDGLTGLGCLPEETSDEAKKLFAEFCDHLLEPLQPLERLQSEHLNETGQYCWAKTDLIKRTARKVAENVVSRHFIVPSRDFALITRKLSGVFTFISILEAEFNGHDVIAPYLIESMERNSHGR